MSPDYIEKVGHAFLQFAGRGLMLSPRDQELVSRWEKAGIPSDVVIQGIQDAFELKPKRRVHSISFASPAVEKAAKSWRERRIGSGDEGIDHEREWEAALNELIRRLEDAKGRQRRAELAAIFDGARQAVIQLQAQWKTRVDCALQSSLEELESVCYERLLQALDPLERSELERSVDAALEAEGLTSPSVRAVTRQGFVRRRLRRLTGLPVFEIDPTGGW